MAEEFSIERFLAGERRKDLLRFCTAGSVDDGKSTLIGRLLLDTGQVYEDQVASIAGRPGESDSTPNLALLTDGLRAERAAGITIDVAYRYFSTARRRFILADTPGHLQYTRNMVTGASTADAAVVLVDVTRGVQAQTRRHAAIAALLGVRHVLLAVNKMDLAGFAQRSFEQVCTEFQEYFNTVSGADRVRVYLVPMSALTGDGVVSRSARMPWYTGPCLLALLEALPGSGVLAATLPFRMAVQHVVGSAGGDCVLVAGQIAEGAVRPGDELVVLPAGHRVGVQRLVAYGGDLPGARAPMSVTLELTVRQELRRGDLLAAPEHPAVASRVLQAALVWMGDAPLHYGRPYLLKHGTRTVPATVLCAVRSLWEEVGQADGLLPNRLLPNDAAVVRIEMESALAADRFQDNPAMGSFVLIDHETEDTVAAGMIERMGDPEPRTSADNPSVYSGGPNCP